MRISTIPWILALALAPLAVAFDDTDKKDGDSGEVELTLENLFPDKGLFGPSARGAAFSKDGRFAAWLYRSYKERRHGNDLWVHDFETGDTTRITSVTVMAPYQKATRKVKEDRIAKAKKRAAKAKKEEKGEGEDSKDSESSAEKSDKDGEGDGEGDEHLGDEVGDDDADDEDAPRYSGVSSFTWSPTAAELMFSSGGDLYRLTLPDGGLVRLTMTRKSIFGARYLPDGSGYTYMEDGGLMKVGFGGHELVQLDPPLEEGESLRSYRLSPDGTKLAILAGKGSRFTNSARKVNIATYRDRFMAVREVPRQVSDDPKPDSVNTVYLYELSDPMVENGKLVKVHSHKDSGPRDVVSTPDWAPDSSRVCFSTFEQSTSLVRIYEAVLPEPEKKEEATDGESSTGEKADADAGDKGDEQKDEDLKKKDESTTAGAGKPDKKSDIEHRDARLVHQFFHGGGPNTPSMIDPQYLSDSRRILLLSEQSGFRHLHVLDPLYESTQQLTRGYFEVYPLELPEHRKWAYATATAERPSHLDVYRIDLEDGTMTRLNTEGGQLSSVAVSPDSTHAVGNYVTYGKLNELVVLDVEGKAQEILTDSHPEKAHKLTQAAPEHFTYKNRHGHEIHGHLFKPDGWNEKDQRPLLIYVYGGPLGTRKQVTDGNYGSDAYFFALYMAKKHGYVTATIDPRGMSGYGGKFEKANFEQVGKPQVEDLTDGVKFLVANYGVDPKRAGIHGWSFGGFQTQMCLYTEPDVFAAGIAGAGPTEWENYNAWYSTGTIGDSREGKPDLEKYSLLPVAKNLKAKLLLVHGMEDSNVLYQDTVRVYAELLEAGKETLVELFLDPTGGHGLGGHIKRLNRYRKYEEFLLRTLGTGLPGASGESPGA